MFFSFLLKSFFYNMKIIKSYMTDSQLLKIKQENLQISIQTSKLTDRAM